MAPLSKPKNLNLRDLHHGMLQIYPRIKIEGQEKYEWEDDSDKDTAPGTDSEVEPDIDIVVVPGLGASPMECWQFEQKKGLEDSENLKKKPFNWVSSKGGLHANFPSARILCFAYPSAWQGRYAIETSFAGIVTGLCNGLRAVRQTTAAKFRPLILIGHSMGGLVVAQALNELDRQPDDDANILPSVTGCLFFGTPFSGTCLTRKGEWVSEQLKAVGKTAYPELLNIMDPTTRNVYLEQLCGNFRQLAARISPSIDLSCFYESLKTDFGRMLALFGPEFTAKPPVSFLEEMFVDEKSATSILPNSTKGIRITTNHRELVRFEAPADGNYKIVLEELKRHVQNAPSLVKKRQSAARQTSMLPGEVDALRRLLESETNQKNEKLVGKLDQESWFIKESVFEKWEDLSLRGLSCLWLTGMPGVGKTSITLSAIANIRRGSSKKINDKNRSRFTHVPLLAFFLCDTTPAGSSPVEMLKALILQLINQNPLVADYAKKLSVMGYLNSQVNGKVFGDDTNATLSWHNLWNCLDNILNDDAFGDVYIIINNVHLLDQEEQSDKLLEEIQKHLVMTSRELEDSCGSGAHRRARRWLFTRVREGDQDRFEKLITARPSHVVDLSADIYKDKISNSLEEYIMTKVMELRQDKKYSLHQAYMIQDLMKSNAADKHWIDIQYMRLRALRDGTNEEAIIEILGPATAINLRKLKRTCWLEIFERYPSDRHSLQDLLRALALAFCPPTLEELSVLSSIKDQTRLRLLLERCKPMVQQVSLDDDKQGFEFSNPSLKVDFLWESDVGLDPENKEEPHIQRFHGMLALRCFSHMEDTKALDEPRAIYPWEYWLKHAMQGKPGLAKDLVRELGAFWQRTSPLREAWLQYCPPKMPSSKTIISHGGMMALHAAAIFGYDSLVRELMSNGHEHELIMLNDDGYTPLHIAAMHNHTQTVRTLLGYNKGAVDKAGPSGTALHVAATQGHVETLVLLLDHGADPNAFCAKLGPVINAAIRSGNNEAVQRLLHHSRHHLTSYGDQTTPPLALAADLSAKEVFKAILTGGKGKWQRDDYRQALDKACFLAKPDSVELLLKEAKEYLDDDTLRNAMLTAAVEDNWKCVDIISEAYPGLAGDEIFYLAAVTIRKRDDKVVEAYIDRVLNRIWSTTSSSISKEVINAALYQATDNEKYNTVRWLLDPCGAKPNDALDKKDGILPAVCFKHDPPQRYGNALTAAAWDGSKAIVDVLLAYGADVDNDDGCALQMAAQEGYVEVVKTLLRAGARINRIPGEEQSYRGPEFRDGTALQAACRSGRTEVVKILLEWEGAKANPNLGRGPFRTPILAATQGDQPQILKLLLAAGADVNGGVGNASTPLINAAFYMSAEATELLIESGASVNQVDGNGDTAIILAALKGDARILQLLIDNKAELLFKSRRHGFALTVAANYGHTECVRILAAALTPLFRALNTIAEKNSTMRALLKQPKLEHQFFDEETVRPLREELAKATQVVTETQRIREGWKSMQAAVDSAKRETASYKQKMNDMQEDWDDYRDKTDQKQENYDVSIKGFRTVERERAELMQERDGLKQELKAYRMELAQLRRDFNTAIADAKQARDEADREIHQEKMMRERVTATADAREQTFKNEIGKLKDDVRRLTSSETGSSVSQEDEGSALPTRPGKPNKRTPFTDIFHRKSSGPSGD